MSYGVVCVLSDFILLISAQYLLRVYKLNTKMTKVAFVLFWCFFIVDTVIFLSNNFTFFAYYGSAYTVSDISFDYFVFRPLPGTWLEYHLCFILMLGLLISISMTLKTSSVPFVYAGKYIFIGLFFLFISVVNSIILFRPALKSNIYVSVFLINLIPLILYFHMFYYRPRFIIGAIRRMVFDKLGSPLVLFDGEDLLADFNKDAANLFALEPKLINHLKLSDFLRRSVGGQVRERSSSTVEEVVIKAASGEDSVYKLDYSRLNDKQGKDYGTLLLFHNISELKKLYNSMERIAMTDMLTGLSSRLLLQKKITEINLYRKFPYTAVVCSINGIHLISEGFGEDAGKSATMHVADLLRSQLRATDFIAYDDGNMIVLMPDTSEQAAEDVFQRISRILNHDRTFYFRLSFEYGVASKPTKSADMQLIVSQAQASMLRNKIIHDEEVHKSIIDSLREALRLSSFETEQHSFRVSDLAEKIAEKLKLPEEEINNLKLLASFHDIGKMAVPEKVLNKPSSLTEEELKIIQLHVISGYKIANASEELAPIARGILCHHERWDGNGYPNGYEGSEIPFLARIVSVADSFDVMTHDRPYKKAMSVESAIEEIKANSGKQFDPAVVAAFLTIDFSKYAEKL